MTTDSESTQSDGPRDKTAQINIMSELLDSHRPLPRRQRRWPALFGEGLLFSGVALVLSHALGLPESGLFAIVLMAAGLTDRVNQLLQENKAAVYKGRTAPWRVNATTIASLMTLFAGLFAACVAATLWWGESGIARSFAFAMESTQLGDTSLLTRRFGSFLGLLGHNGLVLGAFFLLSVVYRAYGILLAVCWNACVWAVVLTLLVWREVGDGALPKFVIVAVSAAAVLPHLMLEVLAYLVAGLAGIFLSKAVTRYELAERRFRVVGRTVVGMIGIAILLLVLAALLESTLPRLIVTLVS